MADRWRGILGSVDDEVAPGQDYQNLLSRFGIHVSKFPLTYRDELIDEASVWGERGRLDYLGFTHRYSLYGYYRLDCLESLTATLYMAITQRFT